MYLRMTLDLSKPQYGLHRASIRTALESLHGQKQLNLTSREMLKEQGVFYEILPEILTSPSPGWAGIDVLTKLLHSVLNED